jgi:hypothetical protein
MGIILVLQDEKFSAPPAHGLPTEPATSGKYLSSLERRRGRIGLVGGAAFSIARHPAWRGMVWVKQISEGHLHLDVDSISGHKHVWGDVLVVGDEEVMDALAKLYRGF